jgi:hypothetical protein
MIKMGKTRYSAFGKNLTSKEIVDLLRRKKKDETIQTVWILLC